MTTMEVVWLFVGFGLGALTMLLAEKRSKHINQGSDSIPTSGRSVP